MEGNTLPFSWMLHVCMQCLGLFLATRSKTLARTSTEDSRVERWTIPGLMIVMLPNNPENVYIFMREYLSDYLTI